MGWVDCLFCSSSEEVASNINYNDFLAQFCDKELEEGEFHVGSMSMMGEYHLKTHVR
jgi:hypothetical protein